jgi:hypothetical protein
MPHPKIAFLGNNSIFPQACVKRTWQFHTCTRSTLSNRIVSFKVRFWHRSPPTQCANFLPRNEQFYIFDRKTRLKTRLEKWGFFPRYLGSCPILKRHALCGAPLRMTAKILWSADCGQNILWRSPKACSYREWTFLHPELEQSLRHQYILKTSCTQANLNFFIRSGAPESTWRFNLGGNLYNNETDDHRDVFSIQMSSHIALSPSFILISLPPNVKRHAL